MKELLKAAHYWEDSSGVAFAYSPKQLFWTPVWYHLANQFNLSDPIFFTVGEITVLVTKRFA